MKILKRVLTAVFLALGVFVFYSSYLRCLEASVDLGRSVRIYFGELFAIPYRVLMGQIKVEKNVGGIEGLHIIEPAVHGDSRGYFMETYNKRDMEEAGLDMTFVQDNQSQSRKGVLRGLHFQINYPQGKLVRVIRGRVFDVAVDIRKGSKTYGKWFGVELSEENKKQFYISEGFAHGFLVLSEVAEFCYKVTDFYHPGDEGGIAWNDPAIGIKWPEIMGQYRGTADPSGYTLQDGTPLTMSEKDKGWGTLEKK